MSRSRHRDRLEQAKADFQWGEDSLDHGHFAQTCFIAQQVAEKARLFLGKAEEELNGVLGERI